MSLDEAGKATEAAKKAALHAPVPTTARDALAGVTGRIVPDGAPRPRCLDHATAGAVIHPATVRERRHLTRRCGAPRPPGLDLPGASSLTSLEAPSTPCGSRGSSAERSPVAARR